MTSDCYGYCVLSTPIGRVGIVGSGEGVVEVVIDSGRTDLSAAIVGKYPSVVPVHDGMAAAACLQLDEYFSGGRRVFDLKLDWTACTDFAISILQQLARVPFGETLTYGELAGRAGFPGRARAVGQIMAKNRMPLILPCHRIIGSGGGLTGYSGGEGIKTKRWLLAFENNVLKKNI